MVAFPANSAFAQIWEQVRNWPPAERKLLAAQIIESLPPEHENESAVSAATKPTTSAADLIGLWAGVEPKPSDEDLRRILEESLLEKHWH